MRYARSLGLDSDHAADVVHTVMVKLLVRSEDGTPPKPSYINRAVLNCTRDQARARAREARLMASAGVPSPLVPRPDELLDLHTTEQRFVDALSELPRAAREYYVAVELRGFPIDAVAAEHGVSRKAIEMRLASARSQIRSRLMSM